jgi:outer membrane protein OmpA-like peptidoglycan-associated protein
VVEGTWTAADLVELTSITTVSGDELSIEADADGVILGGAARVVGADVSASNGVLHVLDTVLVPQTVSSQLTAQAVTSLLSLEPIQFADSSATITEDSIPTLQEALELLAADPGARLEIAGHTDDVGPAEGNTRLSQRRADAVREWLIANGADAERLVAVGYGEGQPLADNSTEDGRAANRRIEFVAQ